MITWIVELKLNGPPAILETLTVNCFVFLYEVYEVLIIPNRQL